MPRTVPQGLKPGRSLGAVAARLKSCPFKVFDGGRVFEQPLEPPPRSVFSFSAGCRANAMQNANGIQGGFIY